MADRTADPLSIYPPAAIAWARKECGLALTAIREQYKPSEAIETVVIASFLHGAAAAFNMDAELGDVASLKDIANG